jgi:spore germination protein YaaH
MRTITRAIAFALSLAVLAAPAATYAASLEVAGWIPYWRAKEGAKDAQRHLSDLDAVFPFAFTVKSNGSLKDEGKLSKSHWKSLFRAAGKADVDVLPTVMSSDGALIHKILSDEEERAGHVAAIVKMVEKGKYDGVDIDYEAKWSETRPFFAAFLVELDEALEGKELSCTIEARTPPEALYRDVPATIDYANDYATIARVCDRVNIMAYDQQRADLQENDCKRGEPYAPVSDVDWARKVVALALRDIPASKIHLGVPTYGREWAVTVAPDWYRDYRSLWSLNPEYAEDLEDDLNIDRYRAKSGEAALTYFEDRSIAKKMKKEKIPSGTPEGLRAAAQALAYANRTGESVVVNFVTWSDDEAVAEKVELAAEFGLAGVAIFKIDGGEDAGIWKLVD